MVLKDMSISVFHLFIKESTQNLDSLLVFLRFLLLNFDFAFWVCIFYVYEEIWFSLLYPNSKISILIHILFFIFW